MLIGKIQSGPDLLHSKEIDIGTRGGREGRKGKENVLQFIPEFFDIN
jgi:hypothetical protein